MRQGNWDSMDIAKIRKKAKERKEAVRSSPMPEEAGVEKRDGLVQAASERAASATPAVTEKQDGEEAAVVRDGVSAVPLPPSVVETRREEPATTEAEEPSSETGEDPADVVELLTFSLSTEEFAFRVSEVEEIIRYQPITKVPAMPDYVLGITSLRGKIMPVIDLKTRIVSGGVREDGAAVNSAGKKIFILLGPHGPIGATIDRVNGVVRLPQGGVLEPPAHLLEEERKFVDGVVILDKRFISIIRCEEALKIEVT